MGELTGLRELLTGYVGSGGDDEFITEMPERVCRVKRGCIFSGCCVGWEDGFGGAVSEADSEAVSDVVGDSGRRHDSKFWQDEPGRFRAQSESRSSRIQDSTRLGNPLSCLIGLVAV